MQLRSIQFVPKGTMLFKGERLWSRVFPIELKFGSVGFCGGKKT